MIIQSIVQYESLGDLMVSVKILEGSHDLHHAVTQFALYLFWMSALISLEVCWLRNLATFFGQPIFKLTGRPKSAGTHLVLFLEGKGALEALNEWVGTYVLLTLLKTAFKKKLFYHS